MPETGIDLGAIPLAHARSLVKVLYRGLAELDWSEDDWTRAAEVNAMLRYRIAQAEFCSVFEDA